MKSALIFLFLACCLCSAQAESYTKSYAVGPGSNGTATFTLVAKAADQILVSFTAASGYELVSADCDDSAKLGWTRTGPFSFALTVRKDLKPNTFHTAKFYGKLRPTGKDGGGGNEQLVPWDMNGRFSVLADHEGMGTDDGRTPPAGLKSDKPGGGPQTVGQATYNTATKQFDGSFTDGGQKFLGVYTSIPAVPDIATARPKQLGSAEDKPCPDNDGVTVKYVYFGAENSGGIGGKAAPDTIQINGFTQTPSAADARKDAEAKAAARKQADAAADAALKKSQKADADAAKAKAEVEKALANRPGVKAAQQRVAAAQQAVKNAEQAKTVADKEMAIVEQMVAAGKLARNSARYRNAQAAVAAAAQAVKLAQANLTAAQAALAKAMEQAQNDPAVKQAQQQADAADAAAKLAAADYTTAKQAAEKAAKEQAAAEKLADEREAIDKAWEQVKAGTLVHEEGHRRICHFYADKLTDMLNKLRTWGYALTETRAATLGRTKYSAEWTRQVKAIQDADIAKQTAYDGPGGTDHGQNQGNWNWKDQLK